MSYCSLCQQMNSIGIAHNHCTSMSSQFTVSILMLTQQKMSYWRSSIWYNSRNKQPFFFCSIVLSCHGKTHLHTVSDVFFRHHETTIVFNIFLIWAVTRRQHRNRKLSYTESVPCSVFSWLSESRIPDISLSQPCLERPQSLCSATEIQPFPTES